MQHTFLQRVSIACYAELCTSYSKSVRLSVTRWHCVKMTHATIMRSSPEDSPMTLVSSWLTSARNSKGNIGTRELARRMREGQGKWAIFTARCTLVQSAVLRSHVVRPSVCPSVTLVDHDHIGWQSSKLIARTISPTSSLFTSQMPPTYSQGNIGKFWEDSPQRSGGQKWRAGAQKRQYL